MSESTLEIRQRERLLRLDTHIRFEFELTAQRDLSSYRGILSFLHFHSGFSQQR